MQTLDCVSDLYSFREFSQTPECLDEAMLARKKSSIAIIKYFLKISTNLKRHNRVYMLSCKHTYRPIDQMTVRIVSQLFHKFHKLFLLCRALSKNMLLSRFSSFHRASSFCGHQWNVWQVLPWKIDEGCKYELGVCLMWKRAWDPNSQACILTFLAESGGGGRVEPTSNTISQTGGRGG